MIAGVDEAGRGPVIGPMVMAIVACDDQDELQRLGAKDSKQLTSEQREMLVEKLAAYPHEIISVSPKEIDNAVMGQKDNLNLLEARVTAQLIYQLSKKVSLSEVILDSPTRTVASHTLAVKEALLKLDPTIKVKLTSQIKADANHPVVGAASIFAKTERDKAIKKLESKHGTLGSGYPADPQTQQFLAEHWKEPHDFFRKSWESYQRHVTGAAQKTLASFEQKEHSDKKKFSALQEHGFAFLPTTNQYETVRLSNGKSTVIAYNTGKVVVQGPSTDKHATEKLLANLRL